MEALVEGCGLGLTAPGASGLVLVGGATVGAVALARALAPERRTALPA